jgi:hypothetical protein
VPEAWRLTAELAEDLGIDEWRSHADRMVAELVAGAGPQGETFGRQAGRWLDKTRSSRRSR